MFGRMEPAIGYRVLTSIGDADRLTCIVSRADPKSPTASGLEGAELETTMMQDLSTGFAEGRRRPSGSSAPMAAALGLNSDMTDSEAFAILRQRFPQTALCERVAAVARWRKGG